QERLDGIRLGLVLGLGPILVLNPIGLVGGRIHLIEIIQKIVGSFLGQVEVGGGGWLQGLRCPKNGRQAGEVVGLVFQDVLSGVDYLPLLHELLVGGQDHVLAAVDEIAAGILLLPLL